MPLPTVKNSFVKTVAVVPGGELAKWEAPISSIKPGVPLSNPVTRWGPFKADETPLSTLLPLLEQAGDLADHANWPEPPL